MPKDRANSKPPIILAPSNSAEAAVTVPDSMAVRYAAHMAIPTMPTSMGFSVRSHKIPMASAQKITMDRPPKIESKGISITFNGSFANMQVPSSTQVGFSASANASGVIAPIVRKSIRFRLNDM